MKKQIIGGIGVLFVLIIILLIIFLGDKNLDTQSTQIKELYNYLGEVDIYHCGGLNSYSGTEVNYDTIKNENKLCMAYYALDENSISLSTAAVSSKNDNDISLCMVGEGTTLAAEEGDEDCDYQIIAASDLAKSYEKIYGEEIPDDKSFYINDSDACYLDGEYYYCGNAETFVFSLMPEATVYRLIDKAVEKLNNDIVITDYYLRLSDNKCYPSNTNSDEITECSDVLKNNDDLEIDSEFIYKYGSVYKHVFKLDNDGNYYWYSSDLK